MKNWAATRGCHSEECDSEYQFELFEKKSAINRQFVNVDQQNNVNLR